MALDDYGIEPSLTQQMTEQQARGPGAYDRNLPGHDLSCVSS